MDEYIREAYLEAQQGLKEGGIPIGAVLVHKGKIIGRGHNRRVQKNSAILHGEMDAIENAGRQPSSVYREATMYTTLSPCLMCSGTMIFYGIKKVVIGEHHHYCENEDFLRTRGIEVEVLGDRACISMMCDFVKEHRQLWNEDSSQNL